MRGSERDNLFYGQEAGASVGSLARCGQSLISRCLFCGPRRGHLGQSCRGGMPHPAPCPVR